MRPLLIVLAAGVLALAAAGGSSAGKAGLTADPSIVARGSTFTLAGCGYQAPTSLSFKVVGPGVDYFTAGEPLTTGCFSESWTAWWATAGVYSITSYYRDAKGATHKSPS
jgi:hypothetical protein